MSEVVRVDVRDGSDVLPLYDGTVIAQLQGALDDWSRITILRYAAMRGRVRKLHARFGLVWALSCVCQRACVLATLAAVPAPTVAGDTLPPPAACRYFHFLHELPRPGRRVRAFERDDGGATG